MVAAHFGEKRNNVHVCSVLVGVLGLRAPQKIWAI